MKNRQPLPLLPGVRRATLELSPVKSGERYAASLSASLSGKLKDPEVLSPMFSACNTLGGKALTLSAWMATGLL